jgi:hypothetical protein
VKLDLFSGSRFTKHCKRTDIGPGLPMPDPFVRLSTRTQQRDVIRERNVRPVSSSRATARQGHVLWSCCRSPIRSDCDTIGIEIPAKVKQAIGLDDARSWVIVSEHNIDEWPNAGLSPVPRKPGVFGYGFIPPGLFAQIKARFLENRSTEQEWRSAPLIA